MAQGYPPEYLLNASYDIGKSTLRVSAERRAAAPADVPRPKLARWRIADGRFHVKVDRLGGQGRVPRVLGLEKPLADPATFFDWGPMQNDPSRVVYGDYTYTQFPLDWTGCKQGYYKITITAALEIEGRGRLDQDVFQVVYWQPTPPPSTFVRVGQKFLSTTIRPQPMPEINSARVPVPKVGSILTVKDVVPKDSHSFSATLTGGGQELEAELRDYGGGPRWLHPVMEDSSTRALTEMYLGKTVYPIPERLRIFADDTGELRYKQGAVSVVIRGVWRAARHRVTHFMMQEVFGGVEDPVHSWLPIYVVFDISSSAGAFHWNETLGTRLITCVADPWEFERVFSLTSMGEDCKEWLGQDGEMPKRPRAGMTPTQVAWIWGWPLFTGTQAESLALPEWRYTPDGDQGHSFFFKDGKLLPGKYVSDTVGAQDKRPHTAGSPAHR